ncbi:MAG TPA: branched-chain amino acid ABC transporter permease [Acetobacteraceae bacterium]|nr:branched-chain amino acid ABC transporter permease [Acetobacteraceae bacterium]
MNAVLRPNAITRRRTRELAVGGVLLVVLALLPLPIDSTYLRGLMVLTLLYAGLAQGWNILGGYCGQISLGHALYFGIGAYTSTLLYTRLGIPPSLGLFAGAALGALAALAVGWPCFRLSGHYYAIATLVVGLMVLLLVQNWGFVNAAMGITIPFRTESWAQLEFRVAVLPFHYVMLAYAAIAWIIAWVVEGSRWGFIWRAVKDDVAAARSLAVRVFPSKMAAAAISGAIVGAGGALYAQYVGFIDPDSVLGLSLSVLIALPAVVGGVGTLWGPLLGAAVLIPVQQLSVTWLGSSGNGVDLMIYGALIMGLALARPQGLVSLFGLRSQAGGEVIDDA